MNFKIETVQLIEIDSSDESYRITTNNQYDDLTRSILNIGLIHPPILSQKDHSHSIVSGFRRILACEHLGWTSLDAYSIGPEHTDLDCVKLSISENVTQRPLNLIELSRSISMLNDRIPGEKELLMTAKDLGIADNWKFIKKLIRLCHMPQAVQQGIMNSSISLPVASDMNRLNTDEINEFASLFNDLKVGLNIQREIMLHVQEIAKREDMAIMDVLSADSIQMVLGSEKLDRPLKTQNIRKYLKERRYPELSRHENGMSHILKKLTHYPGIGLIPPKNFEETEYRINIDFQNLTDLRKKNARLQKLIKNQEFQAIFK